jgi:hypothetical protein
MCSVGQIKRSFGFRYFVGKTFKYAVYYHGDGGYTIYRKKK